MIAHMTHLIKAMRTDEDLGLSSIEMPSLLIIRPARTDETKRIHFEGQRTGECIRKFWNAPAAFRCAV